MRQAVGLDPQAALQDFHEFGCRVDRVGFPGFLVPDFDPVESSHEYDVALQIPPCQQVLRQEHSPLSVGLQLGRRRRDQSERFVLLGVAQSHLLANPVEVLAVAVLRPQCHALAEARGSEGGRRFQLVPKLRRQNETPLLVQRVFEGSDEYH